RRAPEPNGGCVMDRMRRPSAATVIACVALFVALGSAAYGGLKLPKNSVKTKNIKDNAVKESKIADGSVTTNKLGDAAVTTPKIADNAVSSGKIADNAVSSGKIGNGSVTKAKLAAAGTATNAGNFSLSRQTAAGNCAPEDFNAPGVQPGDVVALTAGDLSGHSLASVGLGQNTVSSAGHLNLMVCNEDDTIGGSSVGIRARCVGYVAIG